MHLSNRMYSLAVTTNEVYNVIDIVNLVTLTLKYIYPNNNTNRLTLISLLWHQEETDEIRVVRILHVLNHCMSISL